MPFTTRHLMVVPADDENCYRFSFNAQPAFNSENIGGPPFFAAPKYPYTPFRGAGVIPREWNDGNDYQLDREAQRGVSFSGIPDFVSQDLMVTETMGPIYDRTKEHLGSIDRAIMTMRRQLLEAARSLGAGEEPPAVPGSDRDFRAIRSAEKILEPGEDWRALGTDDDPLVKELILSKAEADRS